jgi:subtilisin family serine protease
MQKLFFLAISFIYTSISVSFSQNLAKDWHHLDPKTDGKAGISTYKAYEFLKNKPAKSVIVAIIDSGVEIDHPDLAANIWTNTKEIAGNGIDDDENGYIDDLHGWDFLGNKNGEDLAFENLELVRELKKMKESTALFDPETKNKKEQEQLKQMASLQKAVEKKKNEVDAEMGRFYIQLHENLQKAKKVLHAAYGPVPITDSLLNTIALVASEELQAAKRVFKMLENIGAKEEDIADGYSYFNANLNYHYNEDYNGRSIIGDQAENINDRAYGNAEVEGPDAEHGSHVAGIIGALRSNTIGMQGVANKVQLMVLRAVPNGDERDKDIALALRYAVDNGAQIINMSFGKGLSPQKTWVDDAVKYAESKNVLLVHAAGNDGLDLDIDKNYPNARLLNNKIASNWIEVGASSSELGTSLAAKFSNYGKNSVDVFAPGTAIYSACTNAGYKLNDGTSMAAPVVSGLAALLLSYYPSLSAQQVKQVIESSVSDYSATKVMVPEGAALVSFGSLSKTGGIVNAYNAVVAAEKMDAK